MATYRPALEKFEYDPNSSQTYFEFLGLSYPPAEPQGAVGEASNEMTENNESSLQWKWN